MVSARVLVESDSSVVACSSGEKSVVGNFMVVLSLLVLLMSTISTVDGITF